MGTPKNGHEEELVLKLPDKTNHNKQSMNGGKPRLSVVDHHQQIGLPETIDSQEINLMHEESISSICRNEFNNFENPKSNRQPKKIFSHEDYDEIIKQDIQNMENNNHSQIKENDSSFGQ